MQPVVLPFIVDDKASGPLAAIAANLEKIANATKGLSVKVRTISKAFDTLGQSVQTASQILNSAQFKKGNLDAYLKVMEATTKQLKAQAQHQKQLNDAQLSAAKQQAIHIRAQASAAATMHKADQAAINQAAALKQKTNQQTADMQKKNAQQVANMQAESAERVKKIQAQTANIQARGARGSGGGGGGGGGGAGGAVSATAIVRNIMGMASSGLSIVWKLTKDIVGIAKFLIDIPGKLIAIGSAAVDAVMSVFNSIKKFTAEIIKMSNEFEQFQYSFASMLMASGDFEGVKNQSENIIAALEYANELYDDMVVMAAELPGEAKDFMDAFLLALPSGRKVGLTDPDEFMKMSSQVTAIGISLGHSALRAGNSLNQLLQGTTTKQNALTQKLLTSIGLATVEFNKLKPEERLAKIKEIIEAYGDGIESYKNTFDALYSTMLTHLKEIARLGTKPIFEHSKVILKEVNLLLERFGPQVRGMLWELSMDVLDYVVVIQNFLRPILEDTNYYIAVGLEMSRGFFEEFIRGLLTVLPYIKQLGNALKEMVFKVMNYLGVKMPKVTVPEVVLGYPKQIEDFIASEFAKHTPEQKTARAAEKGLLTTAYKGAMAIEPFIPKQMEEFGKALGLSGEKLELFGKELKLEAERKEYEKKFMPVDFTPYNVYKGTVFKSATPASAIASSELSKMKYGEYAKYAKTAEQYDDKAAGNIVGMIMRPRESFAPSKKLDIAPPEYGKGDLRPAFQAISDFAHYASEIGSGIASNFSDAASAVGNFTASVAYNVAALPSIIEGWTAGLPSGIEVGAQATSQASQQLATSFLSPIESAINLKSALAGILVAIPMLITGFSYLVPILATLGGAFATVLTSLPLVGGIFASILGGSILGPILLVIGGFISFMLKYTEQFAVFSGEISLAFADLISALMSFGSIFSILFDIVGAIFAGVLPGLAAFVSGVMSIVSVIFFIAEKAIMPIAKPILAVVKFLSSIVGAFFGIIATALKWVAVAVLQLYNYFKDSAVIKGIGAALQWLYDVFVAAGNAIDRWVGWLIGSANKAMEEEKKKAGITGVAGEGEAKPTLAAEQLAAVQETANKLFEQTMISGIKAAESANILGEVTESYGSEILQGAVEFANSMKNQEVISQLQESALATVAASLQQTEGLANDIPTILTAIRDKFADATYTSMKSLDVHTPEAAKKPPEFTGKTLNNYQDFRGSRFSISQKFEEGFDPDRIAVAFTQDLSKIGEKRIQSGLAPLYTIR